MGMTSAWLLAAALTAAAAPPVELRSCPARARLIELFSSEGCSSCPPADAWMSGLRGHPRLWRDFVPVAFQVSYWDYLGWKDPLADVSYTGRQRAYSQAWGGDGVYTPGFVLDGSEWRRWREGPPPPGEETGVLTARVAGGRVAARFASSAAGPLRLYVARLGMGIVNDVARGENGGRSLRHDFVARGLTTVPMRGKAGAWTAETALPTAASPVGEGALAVWIVGPDGLPLQAVGGLLPGAN